MVRNLHILLLLCLLPLGAMAKRWTPETLPMVHLQDARRYVCNPDGVLSPAAVDSLDCLLMLMERDKGVETVVVAVKQLDGENPYSFGMALGKKYGVGSKKQRSGLIVILATEDRKYQILTGNGLEATLPDAICKRIENRMMVPRLKERDWDGAMIATMKAIDGYVRGDASLKAEFSEEEDPMDAVLGLAFAMIFGGAFIFVVLLVSHQNKCPKCKQGQLRVVRRERVRIGNRREWCCRVTKRCSRCGYEKVSYEEDNNLNSGAGAAMAAGMLLGGAGRRGGFNGGGFSGGSFGGGSFGGGGAGGSF